MKTPKIALLAGVAVGLFVSGPAWSGAKLKIDDESMIDLGFRVQALTIFTDTDLDGDGSFDDETDFRVRRARFRLKGTVNKYVSAFIQTESGSESGGSGTDMRIIDSWVNLKYNNWVQGFFGQHMAPSSRMATTSSGGLMTIDRPNNNTKNLSWGARSTMKFATATFGDSNDSSISGPNAVRDVGATFFGTGSFNDTTHLKYYAGLYDGVQNATTDDDNLRFSARAQLNLFDAEPGYFNLSTYLGKKKTIAFGISYESQDEVQDAVGGGAADYEYYSIDAFADWPVGDGFLTAEAAYSDLDLDDASLEASASQGDGWYFQAGYYINQWQPWFEYEEWDGDAPTVTIGNQTYSDFGDYSSWRIGVSYFLKGHNANIKVGFERFSPDEDFSETIIIDDAGNQIGGEDEIDTFVIGFYTTY